MAKSYQRQGIRQGTTVALFGFYHKIAAEIPEEGRHLLVTGPVLLDTEFKRSNLHTLSVGDLRF